MHTILCLYPSRHAVMTLLCDWHSPEDLAKAANKATHLLYLKKFQRSQTVTMNGNTIRRSEPPKPPFPSVSFLQGYLAAHDELCNIGMHVGFLVHIGSPRHAGIAWQLQGRTAWVAPGELRACHACMQKGGGLGGRWHDSSCDPYGQHGIHHDRSQ